jgi:para-nitrobenzyl esterase
MTVTVRCGVLLLAALMPAVLVAQSATERTRAETENGTIVGSNEADAGLRVFKGIPFAQPPVGKLRWRPPDPVQNWKGEREALRFGPRCMQAPIYSDMVFRSDGLSEDCLYLNVWTLAKSANEQLPVLVYFYGGGFQAGDGSEPRYDGASMARKGIVTLTANYRLGVFGMLAHPDLTKESPHHASGNYTLLDQQAALKWVQQNIAAFGGDPKRVTIAGESAGSQSVSALMASPLSRDLIAGAIGESGAMINSAPGSIPLADAERDGVKFATAVGANSLSALRAVPAQKLLEAATSPDVRLNPIVDGYFLPKPPGEIFAAGEQAKVPLLAGSNSEESSFTEVLGEDKPTVENYQRAVQRLYGEHAETVASMYPAASDSDVTQAATELASDRFHGFSTWKWVTLHGLTSKKPTFYYYYAHPRPTPRAAEANSSAEPKGAVHSAEIEYAMGNLESNEVFAWTEDDYKVSKAMQDYFANFIKTGNPNSEGLPTWSPYNGDATSPRLTIDVNTRLGPDTRRVRYQLLDAIGANGQQ